MLSWLISFLFFLCHSFLQNVVVDSPASLARGLSSKIYRPPKPPLPYVYSSYNQDGAKIRQNVPLLISNENLSKTEAIYDYDASLNMGSVNDGLQIACKPLALQQYPSSNYYDPWLNHAYQPMPCAPLYQDPTYAAPSSIASQSFFTTYPSVRFSLGQVIYIIILSLLHICILLNMSLYSFCFGYRVMEGLILKH